MYLAKFLRTHFLIERLRWLLLYIKVIFICNYIISMAVPLTLSGWASFGAAHGWWGGGTYIPHAKICHTISYNNKTWHSYNLPKEDQKNI